MREEATFVVGRGQRNLSGGGGIPCWAWADTEEAGDEGGGRVGVERRRLSDGSNKRRKWTRAEEVSIWRRRQAGEETRAKAADGRGTRSRLSGAGRRGEYGTAGGCNCRGGESRQ